MVEALERYVAISFLCIALLGCGEWESAPVGKTSCSFGSFNDFIPAGRKPAKMASLGNDLYILDDSYYNVHAYKKDDLSECSFSLEASYSFDGFLDDVIAFHGGFLVQDGPQLKSQENQNVCYARDGIFSFIGSDLVIGSDFGIEIWDIFPPCRKKETLSTQKVLAVAATGIAYYAVEPQNLVTFSGTGSVYRDPMSSTPGNEKNFCSIDRLVANNYGVYLLDKKCKKIGVYDNQAVWRKSISLDSVGIKNVLDIAPAEHSYIYVLYENGVEKINVF